MAPANLKYAATHEWVGLEGGKARFGLSEFAMKEIKDIVYLDLPPLGTAVKAGTPFGAVETVKAAFDLNAPVSGRIAAVNTSAVSAPETVSKDPCGAGWFVEVEMDAAVAGNEMSALMDAAAYGVFCAKGGHR